MGHSIVECELLTGTRSAEGIMASGPVSRTDRPNTWLLRPALRRAQSLDSLEPSTHGPTPIRACLRACLLDRVATGALPVYAITGLSKSA